MSSQHSRHLRAATVAILAAGLLASVGCSISFEHDPAKTVKLEISGISSSSDREEVQETLKGMTDGSSHMMTTTSSGDKMTVSLSPVSDVKAFSRKINFGEVTKVDGRTIKVKFVE